MNRVEQSVSERLATLPRCKRRILLAVSGGVDSMAMCHTIYALRERLALNLGVVHLDHMYRGEQSYRDYLFVKNYCISHALPFYGYRRPVVQFAREGAESFETAARRIRHRMFENVRRIEGYHFIATAHHRDDSVETVLLHLMRGSGLEGLAGIDFFSDHLIRPLCDCSRAEIEDYAERNQLSHVIDATNDEVTFARNRVRHELIPYIERHFNSAFRESIARLSGIVRRDLNTLQHYVDQARAATLQESNGNLSLNVAAFNGLVNEGLRQRLLRDIILQQQGNLSDISFQQSAALLTWIACGRSGSIMQLGQVCFHKRESDVIIYQATNEGQQIAARSLKLGVNHDNQRALSVVISQHYHEGATLQLSRAQFDKGLVLRERTAGDYIRLKGLSGHRKSLKKYFNEAAIPAHQRDFISLIAIEREVIWVKGLRDTIYNQIDPVQDNCVYLSISAL